LVVLAVAFEYVPASHARQSLSTLLLHVTHPWIRLYVPAGQARHSPASGPQYPALQVQLLEFQDPGGVSMFCEHCQAYPSVQYWEAGQISHAWLPMP